MKVQLLKTKTNYKGKDFYDFYIKLDNGRVYSININALFSANVEKRIKAQIISELTLIAEDYVKQEKTQKDTSK